MTLSGFLTRSAENYGGRPFVITDERTASHAEIDAWATRLADGLAAPGVRGREDVLDAAGLAALGDEHPGLADAAAATPDSPGDILYTSLSGTADAREGLAAVIEPCARLPRPLAGAALVTW